MIKVKIVNSEHHCLNGTEGIVVNKYKDSNLLIIVDNKRIAEVSQIIQKFTNSPNVMIYEDYDINPFERISPSLDIINKRLITLTNLIKLDKFQDTYTIITSIAALKRKILPKETLQCNYLTLKVGDLINRQDLLKKLVDFGYRKFINACNPAEFAVRGSIIDLITNERTHGFRIDFEADKIDSIKTFDTNDQKSLEKIENIDIFPCSEIILTETVLNNFINNVRTTYGLKANVLIESFQEHRKVAGQENLLPYFYNKPSTLFDYLKLNTKVLYEFDSFNIISELDKDLNERYKYIKENNSKSKISKDFFPIPEIESLFLNEQLLSNKLNNFENIKLTPFAKDKVFLPITNYLQLSKKASKTTFSILKETLSTKSKTKYILTYSNDTSKHRLELMLNEYDMPFKHLSAIDEVSIRLDNKIVGLMNVNLPNGFNYQDKKFNIEIISESEIFGLKINNFVKKRKINKNIFNEISNFQEGQLVVHIEHGIGRFEGLQAITVKNVVHDFMKLSYANDDKFYLPVENLELISPFGNETNIELDKLGSAHWQLRKAKLKNKIRLAAESLFKIAAQRAILKAPVLEVIDDIYKEFCNDFGYVETEDQLRAIEETIEDLAKGKPMDRLICGDVGFGKTEIALRAAFIAAACRGNNQVAILVPTTLLSRQHFETFAKRFAKVAVRIEQLSKFTSKGDIKKIKQELADGKIDIIIGTHALLAKDIRFKNLGLIIIDEEQHFGVTQKERLKEIKAHCHILTLSATPIPRTLNLSLTGVKELSIIATPPVDRLPIKTFVIPNDELTIREAILREYYRSGRIFYVTPRVMYLDNIVEMLKRIVPEINAVKAHGSMSAIELDKIMNDFYDGKFNILVSTTIIESGLDIPNANTIIIDRSHMFGIAQLYQIRGRVGRGNAQSFAYLTYPTATKLSATATKRLQIIESFENLGAGFSVASHDMDLRGYGNLVGQEQSGHIKEVGLELYQHMLTEAINELKKETEHSDGEIQANEVWSPILNLGISVQIPDYFVPDSGLRLNLYRRIASTDNLEDLDALNAELVDRFGQLPEATQHLLKIVKFKYLSKISNIEKLEIGEKGILIKFKDNQPKHPQIIMKFINHNSSKVKMRSDNKLLITCNTSDQIQTLAIIEKMLNVLSNRDQEVSL